MVISGVVSIVTLFITLFITTHEPPSRGLGVGVWGVRV